VSEVPGTAFRIVPAGDSTLLVEFEPRIDPAVNGRAVGLARAVAATAIAGVRDIVPTFCSVAIYFDPLRTDVEALVEHLEREAAVQRNPDAEGRTPLEIPVCYGGEYGPDLEEVAKLACVSPAEVIAIHSARTYRVFMLGFLPGFAYMGVVDGRIVVPRRPTPRVRVPKGAVAVAGQFTGIYPTEAPGGWRLIGRTPVEPFDLERPSPFLLKAGDAVSFVSIEDAEFEHLLQLSPTRRANDSNSAL
jgi:inhibitor of KinA